MPDYQPAPIGPDIDQLLDGLLPQHVAGRRARLLEEHDAAVREVRERARGAWEEMLGREMTMLLLWGLDERVAELAAKTNLGVRKRELDDELLTELARLRGEFTERVRRLVEDAEAGRVEEGGEAPAA